MKSPTINWRPAIHIAVLCLSLVACEDSPSAKTEPSIPQLPDPPKHFEVEISQMAFKPDMITVDRGDTITFVNHDLVAHDVTEEITKAWTSSPLQNGDAWTLVVQASADYYCSIHPVMKGKIIVQ